MNTYEIAFFISLKKIKNKLVNIDIEEGNPGIGGTQYTFLLTVKYINRMYKKYRALIITDENIDLFDKEIPMKNVENIEDAVKYCEESGINILVINANIIDKIDSNVYNTKIRLFGWAHNTLNWKGQCIAAKTNSIKKIICVSKTQYNNMKDTPCFNKCTYINNVITNNFYENAIITDYSKKNVIYIGSIMPQKGVHNLINIWKYVEKHHPDAQLYIFGGAAIWDSNIELGKMNVADKYYDKIIQNKLNKIKHKKNIHFMGVKGWKDIKKMLNTARVGVVNPSRYMRDETFCISALELGTYGIPLVSRQRKDGLNTTIINEYNGYLEKEDRKIAKKISELLSDEKMAKKIGKSAREHSKNFIVENEILKWQELIENQDECKENNKIFLSLDSILLFHDYILKICYLISSGKVFYLIRKKLKLINMKGKK